MRIFLVILAIVFGLIVVVAVASNDTNSVKVEKTSPYVNPLVRERKEAPDSLRLKIVRWTADHSIMIATFAIENPSNFDVKDMQIRCEHSAPSGTRIDSNERTIFEIVPARSTKTFQNFNMGFIHSQASKTNCRVIKAVADSDSYSAPPAKAAPSKPSKPRAQNDQRNKLCAVEFMTKKLNGDLPQSADQEGFMEWFVSQAG